MNFLIPNPNRSVRTKTPDGVEIFIGEWGNPDGPEILLIHGINQTLLSFWPQINSELAKDFRIIAYDTRGHGDSEKPMDPIYYSEGKRWGDELATVIDTMELKNPALVGWSMGGRIVGQYLIHYGDSGIGGINFVSARVIADAKFSAPGIFSPSEEGGTETGKRIMTVSNFARGCFTIEPPDDEFAFVLAYNIATPTYVMAGIRGWDAQIEDNMTVLRATKVPTLVTHGDKDKVVLLPCADMTASLVPGAQKSIFEGCGHSPFREDAPRYNRELAAFVRSIN